MFITRTDLIACWYGICFNYTPVTKNIIVMRSILYLIAVVLVIAWLVGYLAYGAAGLIHILLVIAVISILLAVIDGRRI
jgi:uncharacterized protein DUF5670